MSGAAQRRIKAEFKKLKANPPPGVNATPVSENNLLLWEVTVNGPPGSSYEGGVFVARLEFSEKYPAEPPNMKFLTPIFHPNVYPDGRVCISILHPFGKDPFGHESPSERWNPLLGIEQIVLSVMSILADPNPNSPANLEASKMFIDDHNQFIKRAKLSAEKSYEAAQRKSIMEATNREYEEALKADQEKDAKKEEEEKEKKEKEEREKKMEKEEKERHAREADIDRKVNKSTKRSSEGEDGDKTKKCKLYTKTDEPAVDCGLGMVNIQFKVPSSDCIPVNPQEDNPLNNKRRFLLTDDVSTVLNFLGSRGYEASSYDFLYSWPVKDLGKEDPTKTLQDVFSFPDKSINIMLKKKDKY